MAINAKTIPTDNPSGALIGYNNLLTASTTTSADKALTPATWERYRPSSGAHTVKFQMGSAADVNYIGIAAHGLSGETVLVQTAATISGALTDVDSVTFADNKPVMLTFDTRNIQEVALVMTLSAASEIGIVYAGSYLQMPRNVYGGHTPLALASKTEYQSIKSDSGNFLGRNIIRKGSSTPFSWQHLDDQWVRDTFSLFIDSAKTLPFFIKWRPDYYSDEVAFGVTDDDIKPANMGGGTRLMSASMSVSAHEDL